MSLTARMAKLEASIGARKGTRKLISISAHDSLSVEERDAFLRQNGVDPEDETNLIVFITRYAGDPVPTKLNFIMDLPR